jgi:carbohydrate kinase (thermoresistant glucokinase family)
MILIVMGVSGSGKSTIGTLLAHRLGWPFHDGDSFHPRENVLKMQQGIPLNDTDRQPWLLAIQTFMRKTHAANEHAVIACSALRDTYRATLLQDEPWVQFLWLHGSRELIEERMRLRVDHFMPVTLLESQLKTLEPPANAMVIDISASPEEVVDQIIQNLRQNHPQLFPS